MTSRTTRGLTPRIRRTSKTDVREWQKIRKELWPDTSSDDHRAEISEILTSPGRAAGFVSSSGDGSIDGFLEATLREFVDGCTSSPVGYIEGWYVVKPSRRKGIGARLVRAAEQWASSKGAKEMASDTESTNRKSQRAHTALGYRPVQRVVIFAKRLR